MNRHVQRVIVRRSNVIVTIRNDTHNDDDAREGSEAYDDVRGICVG